MEVAPDAAKATPAKPKRSIRVLDNPVMRAVARAPLPLGAKLLIGFAVLHTEPEEIGRGNTFRFTLPVEAPA